MHDERQYSEYDRFARWEYMYYQAHRNKHSRGRVLEKADFNPYEQNSQENSIDTTYTGNFETREEYDAWKESQFDQFIKSFCK